jgi:hypothetical protein
MFRNLRGSSEERCIDSYLHGYSWQTYMKNMYQIKNNLTANYLVSVRST